MRRFRVRLDGIVGAGFRNAGGSTADLRRRLLRATVQRHLEVGGCQDQGSTCERENGCLVAAAGATRTPQTPRLRFPRRTVIPPRSGLSWRADPRPAGLLRSRWKRGASR